MFYTPLDVIEDASHSLLEPPSPRYSRVTVHRALAVWLHCGQRNSFRAVCDYYHRLEGLEEQLPTERRALSRHPELTLFTQQPPTSEYLVSNYPQLYCTPNIDHNCLKKLGSLSHGDNIENQSLKLEKEIPAAKPITKKMKEKEENETGATKEEIVETSQMIGNFCKNSKIALKTFLGQFKDHALKCELKDTVINVGFYIKRKMVHEEMVKHFELKKNFPDLKKVTKTNDKIGKSDVMVEKVVNNKGTYAEIIKSEDKIESPVKVTPKVLTNDVLNQSMEFGNDKIKIVEEASPLRILKRENSFQQNFGNVEISKCRKI